MPYRLLVYSSLLTLLSSCTFSKIVVHFKPNTTDHERIFACDTLPSTANDQAALAPMAFPMVAWAEAARPDALPPLEQWVTAEERKQGEALDAFLTRSKTTAFLVLRHDSLLYEQYANGGQREQARIVFSVTKALVATLTAIAVEEGKLALDQPVHELIPDFAGDQRRALCIRHLLHMTSGLRWNDFQNIWKLGNLYYTHNEHRYISTHSHYRYEPGTHFAYQSLATQILGICLEEALEQPLAEYFRVKLWQPLGMTYEGYMTLDSKKHRHARTFGGFALTARDMARFGQLMLHDGIWQGQQLIPAWFIQDLRTRDRERWFGYCHSYWRTGYEEAAWQQNEQHWAAGFLGQYIYIAPQEKMVVVRQGDGDDHNWSFIIGRLVAQLDRGRNDLTDPALDYSAQFAGRYESETGGFIQLQAHSATTKQPAHWTWEHNLPLCEGNRHLKYLTQMDGVSIGHKKRHKQTRLYYDIDAQGKVRGLYYHAWPTVQVLYFKKIAQ